MFQKSLKTILKVDLTAFKGFIARNSGLIGLAIINIGALNAKLKILSRIGGADVLFVSNTDLFLLVFASRRIAALRQHVLVAAVFLQSNTICRRRKTRGVLHKLAEERQVVEAHIFGYNIDGDVGVAQQEGNVAQGVVVDDAQGLQARGFHNGTTVRDKR